MRFEQVLQYAAPVDEVHAMLTDPAFRRRVCERIRATDIAVDVSGQGSGATVVVLDYKQETTGVPAIAKKVVGDRTQIVQRETWAGPTNADFSVEIPGKPGRADGTITLADDGQGGTVYTATGDLTVKVPLIGGKLEPMVADLIKSSIRAEGRTGQAWIAGDRG